MPHLPLGKMFYKYQSPMISDPDTPKKLSANEGIKERSNFLRGTIMESLMDESTGAITAEDARTYQISWHLHAGRSRQKSKLA